MKTAIYIEDGIVQLVLTPESKFEKNALASFHAKPLDAKIFDGQFYDCNGGWSRHADTLAFTSGCTDRRVPDSLIIRIEEANPSAAH